MKTNRQFWHKFSLTLATISPPLLVIPIAFATTLNPNQITEKNQNPQDQFDLTWPPTQPTTIVIPTALTNQPFQNVIDTMFANQQLTISWQFDLVTPYQLLNQFKVDYQELTKAFSFNYFDPDLNQWTSDHNWKFAISDVHHLDQNRIDLSFEIYQFDQNNFATGQIATIKQTFSLQNQLPDPATYYQTILKQIKLVRKHDVSNISFATLLQNLHFASDFQAWWMLPPIIGANLKLTLGTQLIQDQIVYDLTINDQYHLNHQIYQIPDFPQSLNYAILKSQNFSDANQYLKQWTNQVDHINYLTIINDQTSDHLIFNQDWSPYNVRNIDLQGFSKLTFQTNFSFPSYDHQNYRGFTGDLKFAKSLKKLSVPGQYQQANNVNRINLFNLPKASSYQQLESWSRYFYQNNDYQINQFEQKWIEQILANNNFYDQSQQLLNLELISQWLTKWQNQIPPSLIRQLLATDLKTNVKTVTTLVLPLGATFNFNLFSIDELFDWTNLSWKTIKEIKFASQWINETNPQSKVYEQIDLSSWVEVFQNVPMVGFDQIVIGPEIIVANYPSFAKVDNVYQTTSLNVLPFQIKRILNPAVVDLVKTKTLDLDQNLPVQLINPLNNKQTIADYGASAVFNSFDLKTNKQLYDHLENFSLTINNYNYVDWETNLWGVVILPKQFGFLFNQPDWLLTNWNPNNAQDQQIKSDRIRHINLKTNQVEMANRIFQNLNGDDWSYHQGDGNAIAIANLNFQIDRINGLAPQDQIEKIIKNGVLDFQAYQNQFDPTQFSTSLINFQDRIKTIDLTNVTTIKNRSLAGLKFTNPITLDLTNITTIEPFAFATSNLKFNDPKQWKHLQTLGDYAFSALVNPFEKIDLSTNQFLQIIPTGAFANTTIKQLKLPLQIDTIKSYAFANTNINSSADQPLDLKALTTIEPFAFANNFNLKYVQTGANYTNFSGFEFSGLVSFDFRYIKTIDLTRIESGLVLPNFNDQVLNLINVTKFSGHFNLPSVNKIILNPQLIFHTPISGFINLKTLVNYNALVDPMIIFGPTKQIQYQLIDSSTYQPSASDIGYDLQSGVLDWRFWNPLLEQDDYNPNKGFNQIISLTKQFFATNEIEQIERLILPNHFNLPSEWWNKFAWSFFNELTLPPIKILAIEKTPTNSSNFSWLNPWLTKQTITRLDQNFFLNYGRWISANLFHNVQFGDSEQVVNLKGVQGIEKFAFWNSNLNHFIGLEKVDESYRPDMNAHKIDDYAFNPHVSITIASQFEWTKRSFGIDQNESLPPSIKINNYQNPTDPTWGGYYDPTNKILDFTNLKEFPTTNDQWQFLKPLQSALKNTLINVLVLPQWNAIHAMWLQNWTYVNKLVINKQTTILAYDFNKYGNPEVGINVTTKNRFKTIPPLAFTNIIEDHTNFWKD